MVKPNNFYFLKDGFLKKYDLMQNKGSGHYRPFFCCLRDEKTPGIYWMIPCSTKLDKYNALYEKSINRFGRCDTIDFIKIYNKQMAVILKSAIPCINKYVKNKYVNPITGNDVKINNRDMRRLEYKLNRIINKELAGKHLSYYNLFKIYDDLSMELNRQKQIKRDYIKSLLDDPDEAVNELVDHDITMKV